MSYQNPIEPAKGARRKGLLGLGIVVLLGGVGAGAALFVTSSSQYEEAVQNLQRAPVGCDTEFDFTGTGTFVFYTETKGSIGEIRGDCENTDNDYDSSDDGRRQVTLTLVDEDGNDIDLDRRSGISYNAGGYIGEAVRSVVIDEPGDYTLSVESDDDEFAIAVGRNPKKDADSLKTIGIIVAGAGLVVGLALILLGLRRKRAPSAPGAPGDGQFAPAGPGAGFGGAPTAAYPQYGQGPPLVSPVQPPLPPSGPYPQPPAGGGAWGAPNQ